jgi:hypothetical protein
MDLDKKLQISPLLGFFIFRMLMSFFLFLSLLFFDKWTYLTPQKGRVAVN